MKKKETLPLIYLLGMPIIFVIANLIARTHFEISGGPFYFSVLLYPLTYLLSGLITKKSSYKKGLVVMAISLITATLTYVLQWALFARIDGLVMIYSFLSFLINQLIFIYTYDFLIKINKNTYGWVLILMLVVSAIDNAFFGAIIEGQYISLSILARVLYVVVIPVFLAEKTKKENKK